MAGSLTVIWWRDIPAQVVAKDRRQSHKVVLHPRFQVAIDKAAMKAGRKAFGDYIEDWRREGRSCGDDLGGDVPPPDDGQLAGHQVAPPTRCLADMETCLASPRRPRNPP